MASDGLWGTNQQIISRPELTQFEIQEQDEFMILASDGIWDVMDNQSAVNWVQRRLMAHRDVHRASRELAEKVKDILNYLIVNNQIFACAHS